MILAASAPILAVIALPYRLALDTVAPARAATIWLVSLTLRALLAASLAIYLALFVPTTSAFVALTSWCWHGVLPVASTHLGLNGHRLGDTATQIPGALLLIGVAGAALAAWKAAHVLRRSLARAALGPGPQGSVIVGGPRVLLGTAGLLRPQVVVSAGALITLDEAELAAGLAHEHAHIARRHRFVLFWAIICRTVGVWLPGAAHGLRELRFHLERDADHRALAQRHDRLALASAICKAAQGPPTVAIIAHDGASKASPRRVRQLLDNRCPSYPPRRGWALAPTMGLVAVVAFAAVPMLAIAGAQPRGRVASIDCAG